MPRPSSAAIHTCFRCLRAFQTQNASSIHFLSSCRSFATQSPLNSRSASQPDGNNKHEDVDTIAARILETSDRNDGIKEQGAMSRRLEEATETALFEGGRAGRQAVEAAGFSEELKAKLLEKVEAGRFRSENASAFAQAELSSNVGEGTRDIASAQAWGGTEQTEDTVLRMLDGARKPLPPGLRGPGRGVPKNIVDFRIAPKPKTTSGERLANARDKTSVYALAKDGRMSEKEREAYRKELKERFSPTARAMPSSFRGLAALANERIEDAIARGQFKNIPRGKAIERDPRADNPFIDTTEYILNKMIQRQDIVPPWIEKQQELIKTADNFRGRMRNDWKRHVARSIASRGGSLHEQVKMANLYAEAEMKHNPKKRPSMQIPMLVTATEDPVILNLPQGSSAASEAITVTMETKHGEIELNIPSTVPGPLDQPTVIPLPPASENQESPAPPSQPLPAPFRDPAWEAAEFSYQTLAIKNLNSIARSYNLMAPDLAKKPYYFLERELKSCFADIAPQVAQSIIERAARPAKQLVEIIDHKPGGVMERFGGKTAKVWDERRAQYGFKEFWRDLWKKDEKTF